MRSTSWMKILVTLSMVAALFIGAGHMAWYQEPADWRWSFAVYILFAVALVDRLGEKS